MAKHTLKYWGIIGLVFLILTVFLEPEIGHADPNGPNNEQKGIVPAKSESDSKAESNAKKDVDQKTKASASLNDSDTKTTTTSPKSDVEAAKLNEENCPIKTKTVLPCISNDQCAEGQECNAQNIFAYGGEDLIDFSFVSKEVSEETEESEYTLDVYSEDGTLVFTKNLKSTSGMSYSWDLKDNGGNKIERGSYTANITMTSKSLETQLSSEGVCSDKAKSLGESIVGSLSKFTPILILLVVVGIVLMRLPRVKDVEHSDEYRKRRVLNWLPLGLTYAFLYMGRYNIKVSQHAFEEIPNAAGESMMSNADFATIFAVGTAVYGASFLINGPLTDKKGGKFAILMGAGGSALMNLLMGLCAWSLKYQTVGMEFVAENFLIIFSVLYGINMYFQSFGAVAIVKVNAPWFHLRERGVFGAIFGILISLGVYFAFDIGYMILQSMGADSTVAAGNPGLGWVFLTPAILLFIFWFIIVKTVKNTPGEAGFKDFNLGDATEDSEDRKSALDVFKLMLSNPVIVTIACIEFCSGFLRQAIMQWYRSFAKQTNNGNADEIKLLELRQSQGIDLEVIIPEAVNGLGLKGGFVYDNWGLLLCCAGIMGGVFAGVISDRVFQSRRAPVAAILYTGMLIGALLLVFVYDGQGFEIGNFLFNPQAWLVVIMSMCIIGVHGMLSGTASMDFGGKKNVGVAVGIIDGFVYAGTAVMSITYALVLPETKLECGKIVGEATNPNNWIAWPMAMIPITILGLLWSLKIWNAKPKTKNKPAEDSQESEQS